MKYDEKLERFLAEYETYENHILKPTYEEITNYLHQLENPAYWGKYIAGSSIANPFPVRITFIRIKRPEKVVDKILRRPEQFPDGLSAGSLRERLDRSARSCLCGRRQNTTGLPVDDEPGDGMIRAWNLWPLPTDPLPRQPPRD
jgi:hypothetical protein